MASDLEYLERSLNDSIERSKDKIEKFKLDLDKGAAYAFEWADTAMTAAAEMEVAQRVLSELVFIRKENPDLSDDDVMSLLKENVRLQFRSVAGRVSRSTSASTNAMADLVRQAWSHMEMGFIR